MDKCPTCGAPARHSAPDGDFKYAPTQTQAEAQAPTTAASVLTDIGATVKVGSDGRWLCLQGIGQHAMLNLESLEVDSVHGPIVRKAINGFLKNLADRLTVGAPEDECYSGFKVCVQKNRCVYPDECKTRVGAPAPAPTRGSKEWTFEHEANAMTEGDTP